MRVFAIVEKGADGLYSVYSEDKIGRNYFGGFGESADEAKADFMESIREAIEGAKTDGFDDIPVFEAVTVDFRYDIQSFFNCFSFLNVSKFASYAGINASKMRAYKSGKSLPGEKTTRKILEAVRRIGADFCSASL